MSTVSRGGCGWGRPDIYIKDLDVDTPKWAPVPTPAKNTTKLTPTKGEKMEALLEGGDPEDVKYERSKYNLEYQIKRTAGKDMPIKHDDGVVAHRHAIVVIPENRLAPGPYIPESIVSVDDAFSTTEGGTDLYQHDAVKPEDGGRKVRWGQYSVTKGEDGAITIKASGGDFGDDPVTI